MQGREDHSPDTPSIQDELPTGPFGRPFPWSPPTLPSTDAADGVFGWLDESRGDIQVDALQPSCDVASTSSGFCNTIVSSLYATKHVDASRAVQFVRWSCSLAFWVSHGQNPLKKAKPFPPPPPPNDCACRLMT